MANSDLTLVIDIGKSRAKLLLVNPAGEVLEQHERANASVVSPLGYPALDVQGLEQWMACTVRSSRLASQCHRVIATTHGAALVALKTLTPGESGNQPALAWEPPDYEFDGFALEANTALADAYQQARDPFAHTLAPDLPAGLNAARQLWWLQHRHPQAWAGTACLLPYPQYWAWVLSGVAASEVSSLGCHTQLWCPQENAYSRLARAQGWSRLFAPMRSAWELLGPVQPQIASDWGLPADCQVLVGVHDSNACLARYVRNPAAAQSQALTLVSSGTWTVLMAPGAPVANLDSASDMLGNVDVLGRCTPTARFMGGRAFGYLLGGADPTAVAAAATLADVQQLIGSETFALAAPELAPPAKALAHQPCLLKRHGQLLHGPISDWLGPSQRAALAALYCAQLTSDLVQRLWHGQLLANACLIVEGPLAHNPVYLALLQALLPMHTVHASCDLLEGTARGAWMLAQAQSGTGAAPFLSTVPAAAVPGLAQYQAAWLALQEASKAI